MTPIIISTDGPAGSGKGTVTKRLATDLSLNHVELGLFFRAVAAIVLESGMKVHEVDAANAFTLDDLGRKNLHLDDVTKLTSRYSKILEVRQALVPHMRELATVRPGSVVDGRSGLHLFPAPQVAKLNFFLTAKEEKRIERRYQQAIARGEKVTHLGIAKALRARDNDDRLREDHPLLTDEQAKDWPNLVFIDNTNLDEEETYLKFQSKCRAVLGLWKGLQENPNFIGNAQTAL